MQDQQLFAQHIMFCNSTGNQTINLIPAIQFKIPEIVIFSTKYTEEKGLTQRLKETLTNRKIKSHVINLNNEEEKNPPRLLNKILSIASDYKKIIWNISGGQKIPTIALQTAFQRRIDAGLKGDILLYLEANPPETWYYDSSYAPHKVRTKAETNLAEILFLYGYDLYEGDNDKAIEIYPHPSNDTKDKLNIGRKAIKYYFENDYFREAFFGWMRPDEPEIKNRNDILELVKDSLNQLKPNVKDIKITMQGYENLEKTINNIIKNLNAFDKEKLNTSIKKLKMISKPEQIFNDYWNGIKREVINKTLEKIKFNKTRLLQRDIDAQTVENLKKQIIDIGGFFNHEMERVVYKEDIQHFSALRKGNGFLFEWMVTAFIYDLLDSDPSLKEFIAQIHLGVKTKPVNSQKYDSELDLVITTKFGTLITLELKTYDFSGETAKAKEGTTFKKSGPYGKAIIVGPILRSILTVNDDNIRSYPHYFDGTIRSQQETAERNGIEYWYLDEIPEKLKRIIK